jgi:hypothetical protein
MKEIERIPEARLLGREPGLHHFDKAPEGFIG